VATRFYFPLTEAAAVSPTISADWEHINTLRRKLLTTPDASTLTSVAYTPDASDHTPDEDAHHRQYVSDQLAAQTISAQTISAQFQALEADVNNNLFLTIKVFVCSSDGGTIKETLLAITRDDTELPAVLANRSFSATSTAATVESDDRIVVEVGLGGDPGGGGGVQGHNGQIRWGCDASSGDLPVSDSGGDLTFRPWLEFANTLTFATGDQTLTPSALAVPVATPAPALSLSLTVAPSALAVPVSVPAPTLSLTYSLAPDPVAIPLVLTTPQIDRTFPPEPLAIPVSIPAPTLTLSLTVAPDPVAIPIAFAAAAVVLTYELTPAPVVVLLDFPAPVVQVDRELLPSPVSIPVAFPAPTIALTLDLAPTAVAVPIVLAAPAISLTLDLVPTPVSTPVVLTTPTIDLTFTLSPTPVAILVDLPAPSIDVGGGPTTLTPSAVAILVVIPVPTVTVPTGGVQPDPIVIIVVIPFPTLFTDPDYVYLHCLTAWLILALWPDLPYPASGFVEELEPVSAQSNYVTTVYFPLASNYQKDPAGTTPWDLP